MAITQSGRLTMTNIVNEFGGTAPHRLSEYYGKGGTPGSGRLKMSDFYGASGNLFSGAVTTGTLAPPGMLIKGFMLSSGIGSISPSTFATATIETVASMDQGGMKGFQIDIKCPNFTTANHTTYLGISAFLINNHRVNISEWTVYYDDASKLVSYVREFTGSQSAEIVAAYNHVSSLSNGATFPLVIE